MPDRSLDAHQLQRAIQADTDFGATVRSKQGEFLAKVVCCKPEEFDAKFDKYIQAILDVGATDIIAQRRQAYLDGNYRGTFPDAAK